SSFRLVLLVLCGRLLFNYVSTEDCRYQLLLSRSCYITSGSPLNDILPCSIETCSAASHHCVYTGSGQDFNYLVFNCSSSDVQPEQHQNANHVYSHPDNRTSTYVNHSVIQYTSCTVASVGRGSQTLPDDTDE
ncbi:hypothetical protein BgiMline_026626, partial [Biomphalaria glabrata]